MRNQLETLMPVPVKPYLSNIIAKGHWNYLGCESTFGSVLAMDRTKDGTLYKADRCGRRSRSCAQPLLQPSPHGQATRGRSPFPSACVSVKLGTSWQGSPTPRPQMGNGPWPVRK